MDAAPVGYTGCKLAVMVRRVCRKARLSGQAGNCRKAWGIKRPLAHEAGWGYRDKGGAARRWRAEPCLFVLGEQASW